MQFGSSHNVLRFGCFLVVVALGTVNITAQTDQYPGLSNSTTSCSSGDPSCQTSDQGNYQGNRTSFPAGQSSTSQQGITLQSNQQQGSSSGQNNRTQQQYGNNNLRPLPPDPPTEYQRMVASTTGKMLKIYGADLFRNTPSTFAPLDLVPVTPEYVVGPGDELLIQVWGQVTLNGRFTVDRSGSIYVPQVGTLRVAGISFGQMQSYLKSQMGKVFRNFDLNVNMGQLRSIQIFVVGQARRPGSFTVSSLSTLVNALFVTGGPTPQGSLRHIQLKRGGNVVVDFDLYDLLQHGDKSKDLQLLPGDVLYIPPVGAQVAVAGNVNTPAIYELKSKTDSSVGEIIDLAAGLSNVASGEKARLERVDERRMRSITEVSLDAQGRSTLMRDGDILEFIAVVDRYKDAITLRGNVANPGRYAWKPGMRVRDLFPDKDALITRDYWLKRGQLGQPVLTYIPGCTRTTPFGIPIQQYNTRTNSDLFTLDSQTNPADAVANAAGFLNSNQDGTPGNLSAASAFNNTNNNSYRNGNPSVDPTQDCTYQTGDYADSYNNSYLNTNNYPGNTSDSSTDNPSDRSSISTAGSANAGNRSGLQSQNQMGTAGSNPNSAADALIGASTGQFRPRNDVRLREPDIDWSYAVVERQSSENLTTSLLPFNLGHLVLEGDATQNLELQPGDVVTIFSKADIRVPQSQQTRFVHLEGEFLSSGVYSVLPGETLQQLVKRAGGFSPDAYLYGSEFTRESTRRVQQQRLNSYIDQVSLQASTNASNNAGRAISPQDAVAAATVATQNQAIITSLRQARASGRVVLNLLPDSNNVAQLPELPLEDGDRFIIPRVPSTVSVDGAVYNQNSFLYDPRLRLKDYVRLAGGSNRDADKKRAYVIRADGSVVSKQYSSSLRGSGFDSLRLNPGDTVVIPLNLNKGASIRNLVNIAQIVGQFGIAIAATNVIF